MEPGKLCSPSWDKIQKWETKSRNGKLQFTKLLKILQEFMKPCFLKEGKLLQALKLFRIRPSWHLLPQKKKNKSYPNDLSSIFCKNNECNQTITQCRSAKVGPLCSSGQLKVKEAQRASQSHPPRGCTEGKVAPCKMKCRSWLTSQEVDRSSLCCWSAAVDLLFIKRVLTVLPGNFVPQTVTQS